MNFLKRFLRRSREDLSFSMRKYGRNINSSISISPSVISFILICLGLFVGEGMAISKCKNGYGNYTICRGMSNCAWCYPTQRCVEWDTCLELPMHFWNQCSKNWIPSDGSCKVNLSLLFPLLILALTTLCIAMCGTLTLCKLFRNKWNDRSPMNSYEVFTNGSGSSFNRSYQQPSPV